VGGRNSQALERKEGLFRMNMMGRLCDYACRSSFPDPTSKCMRSGCPLTSPCASPTPRYAKLHCTGFRASITVQNCTVQFTRFGVPP